MVVLLAVVVIGGLVWLVRLSRCRTRTGRARTDGAGPGLPDRPLGGKRVAAALMSRGRIDVCGLTKEYRGVRAVDDLSFTVEPGRVTGFLGPNGAGKTTTLRMLLDLVEPTAGTATIGGVRYADLDQPIRRVGAILEAGAAHKDRTGRDHLRIVCQSAGIPLARGDEVLELVGLGAAARRTFRGYSLGMRQRLGVAAALLGDPQVLILDEPANGLDPEGIRWMRDLLRTLAAQGRTVLVSSHLLGEMAQLADDLVIVAAGRLARPGNGGVRDRFDDVPEPDPSAHSRTGKARGRARQRRGRDAGRRRRRVRHRGGRGRDRRRRAAGWRRHPPASHATP
jgi:ABC-2 type transport system ATP-binding protein